METKADSKTIDEIPKTMKTAIYDSWGEDPLKLIQIREVPVPTPGSGEILVRVNGASINPIDFKFLYGNYSIVAKTPWRPGFDVGGVVVAVGKSVTKFKVGDEIMGFAHFRVCSTMAEYVAIDSQVCTFKPKNMTCAEASALPLAGLTSYQALLQAGIKKGQKVLILGGTGGTGSLGVQIAKHGFGASHVAVTCSVATNGEWIKGLGADQLVDYKTEKWWEVLKGQEYDIVYDCVGGYDPWVNSAQVLKKNGSYITICGDKGGKIGVGKILSVGMANLNRKFWSLFGNPNYGSLVADNKRMDHMSVIREWVEQGKVKNVLEKTFPLSETAQLFQLSMSGRTRGKAAIVIP